MSKIEQAFEAANEDDDNSNGGAGDEAINESQLDQQQPSTAN